MGTWFETRGGHAPEGATFEGRHDPAVYMGSQNRSVNRSPHINYTTTTTTTAEVAKGKSREKRILSTLKCRVRDGVRRIDYECPMDRLGAGPSRPTSLEKKRMVKKSTWSGWTRSAWGSQESRTVCRAVSPHQFEAWKCQLLRQCEDRNAVRRQSGELYHIYKHCMGVNVKVGWVPMKHGATWCHRITTGVLRR